MMELLPSNSKFDFLGKGPYALMFSALLIIASLYLWFARGEEKFGVDYRGGHEFVVGFTDPSATSGAIAKALEEGGFEGASVQAFYGEKNEFVIRSGGHLGEEAASVKNRVSESLKKVYPDKFEILRSEYVGPTVGKELRQKGLIAICIGLVGILLYIAFRFEMAFAIGAVAALFHDVIVSTGVYLAAGHSLTMGTLAAALTIVGYSVNDTIVIFDRVREEMLKRKSFNVRELINECLNATISRTIITSLLTFFSALALLVFGGGAISDLSLFLVAGLVAGSYSTIYIASPIVIAWHKFRGGKEIIG